VRLAFENDQIVDKTFKGVREDLAGKSRRYDGEILNADGYRSSFHRNLSIVTDRPQI
jgi:hypothetical protein